MSGGLRLVRTGRAGEGSLREVSAEEKRRDQERLILGWVTSQKQRNFSVATIARAHRALDNFLAATGKFSWEITVHDVRDYHDTLCELGLEVTTRRGYLTHIKQFFAFIQAHPDIPLTTLEVQAGMAVERVDLKYGVRLQQPVDRWYMPVHITDDVACKRATRALPTKDELRAFFAFLRGRIEESHKGMPVARDYAMFRFLYHTGMRENEVAMVDVKDLRFDLGTIHCRIGKGSKGSGPRERWIPMLYGLDQVLRIYLAEVRPKFVGADRTKALFLAESGGPIMNRTIRQRLRQNLQAAQRAGIDVPMFTCHDFRRAFATHFYEEHPEKVEVLRLMLGHQFLATTQRYIRPSHKFIEQQMEELTGIRMDHLKGDE